MPITPKIKWPYPSRAQEPWFDTFESMVSAIDSTAYAYREDRQIIFMEGGTFSFSSSTGAFSWSGTIEVLAAITGFRWQIAAGSLNLADGDIVYFDLVRSPTSNLTLTALKASQVPPSDASHIFCIRRGTKIYFKFGYVLLSDVPAAVLSSASVVANKYQFVPEPKEVTGTAETYVGSVYLDGTKLIQVRAMIGSQLITHVSTLRIRRNTGATLLTDVGGVVGFLAQRSASNITIVSDWYDLFLFNGTALGTTICGGIFMEWI